MAPAGHHDRSPQPVSLLVSFWLGAGAFLGLLDGWSALLREAEMAGTWPERLATVVAAVVFDALLGAVLAFVAALPAGLLARWKLTAESWGHALVLAAASAVAVAGLLQDHVDYGFTSGRFWTAMATVTGVALLAVAPLAWLISAARVGGLGRPFLWAAPAALLLAFPVAGLGWGGPGTGPRSQRPDIVLISLDTLRADHLGLYGYPRDTSPHLDAVARESVVFDQAFSHANWTLASHATMLTGLDPMALGILGFESRLDPAFHTLAETLSERGYRTGAMVGGSVNSFVGRARRFDQGFELYRHYPYPPVALRGLLLRGLHHARFKTLARAVGDTRWQVDTVSRWLDRRDREPFFLFFHTYDIHLKRFCLPYESPPPFHEQFCDGTSKAWDDCHEERQLTLVLRRKREPLPGKMDRIVCLYDGGIAFVDHELGRLFDTLRELDRWDNTLLVVTADHGEAFLEHGRGLHTTLHQEILRVPLLVKLPGGGQAGRRIASPVGLTELMPTILDLAGIRSRESSGGGFASLVRGDEERPLRPHYAVALWHSQALIQGPWKYIYSRDDPKKNKKAEVPEELYHLERDPGERDNAVDDGPPELLALLHDELLETEKASQALHRILVGDGRDDGVELTEEQVERLKALGYAN